MAHVIFGLIVFFGSIFLGLHILLKEDSKKFAKN
jgi:hypothetical protein